MTLPTINKNPRKLIRALVTALITFIIVSLALYGEEMLQVLDTNTEPPTGTYRVLKVSDGDTITVDMNGREETIRFIGVDTPEKNHPDKPVQCFAQAATDFTTSLVTGQNVRLETDPINTNRDRYNRLLRYVYLPDNTLVNSKIIEQGFGFAYTSFPFTKTDEFQRLETEAREHSRGLWQGCQVTSDNGYLNTNPVSP